MNDLIDGLNAKTPQGLTGWALFTRVGLVMLYVWIWSYLFLLLGVFVLGILFGMMGQTLPGMSR